MLVGAHRIEINRIQDGDRFILHGRTYRKVKEFNKDTEDWIVEYCDEFTNKHYTVSPYILVKKGNR